MIPADNFLLFDLGGVLIELNWLTSARRIFGSQDSEADLKKRWLKLESAREYEAGKIEFEIFYRKFLSETSLNTAFLEFRQGFNEIIGPLKPGCAQLLEQASKTGRLAMLSNTNSIHVETLRQSSDIFGFFQHLFLSYELGMVKPDYQIYHEVARRLGCQTSQILFFDDSQANIDAASECGMRAFRVDGPDEISKILAQM